jgi:hypothetical protein
MSPPLSERIERSRVGRTLISAAVALLLLAQLGTHLPPSALERAVGEASHRFVRLAAADQSWAVFAPNPRSTSLDLEALVTLDDGSTRRWELPDGPPIGANLRFYRWRKWLERVRGDDQSALWEPTARWIASLYEDEAAPVVRVELIRRFHENVVEGDQPPWQRFTFFTLHLDEDQT